jgi:hypothetical protein
MNESVLPKRSGSRPRTTPTNPHTQLEQNPEPEMVEELAWRVFALPGVEERTSAISVPGARALWLREELSAGPREAFMIGREFAHIHPMPDGSLHAALPPEGAQEAIRKGWAEQHPVARMGYIPQNVVMIYGPRDAEEIEVVAGLVVEAYRYASGVLPGPWITLPLPTTWSVSRAAFSRTSQSTARKVYLRAFMRSLWCRYRPRTRLYRLRIPTADRLRRNMLFYRSFVSRLTQNGPRTALDQQR